jgi:hypothetical protein
MSSEETQAEAKIVKEVLNVAVKTESNSNRGVGHKIYYKLSQSGENYRSLDNRRNRSPS